ncbi:MAG TPA: hypothetical protein VFW75_17420 [Acetobacteraceae bacterium]|nr:hypothetical protein [Acetobacteraceae bacterium]
MAKLLDQLAEAGTPTGPLKFSHAFEGENRMVAVHQTFVNPAKLGHQTMPDRQSSWTSRKRVRNMT